MALLRDAAMWLCGHLMANNGLDNDLELGIHFKPSNNYSKWIEPMVNGPGVGIGMLWGGRDSFN